MAGDTLATILDDILSSTFDISRVLNSLGLHAHALVRARRGETFSTWRRSRKRPASLSLSLSFPFLFLFTRSPGSASNELLSYSTVTAFLREWIPSRFFFSLLSFPTAFFHSSVSQSASGRGQPLNLPCKVNYASTFSCSGQKKYVEKPDSSIRRPFARCRDAKTSARRP